MYRGLSNCRGCGLGQDDEVGLVKAFHAQANPSAAFIRGLQTYLGVPSTGVWDTATHAAMYEWIAAFEAEVEGEETGFPQQFGADPGATAGYVGSTEWFLPELFPYITDFYPLIGLPNEGIGQLEAYVEEHHDSIVAAMDHIAKTVKAAEAGRLPTNGNGDTIANGTPPTGTVSKTRPWVVYGAFAVGGILLLGLVWAAFRSRRSKPTEGLSANWPSW